MEINYFLPIFRFFRIKNKIYHKTVDNIIKIPMILIMMISGGVGVGTQSTDLSFKSNNSITYCCDDKHTLEDVEMIQQGIKNHESDNA